MIHVVEVNLTERGFVLPRGGVGMVIAQPHVEYTAREPFTCTPATKPRQLDAVKATLQVSRAATHDAGRTHFTIFPECSVPGLDGVSVIDGAVASGDWPSGTVVIGGVDGLTRDQFAELAQADRSHLDVEHNSLDRIQAHEWVNCSVTWLKFPDGTVERWIQPKISPAWVERNVQHKEMFQGRSVFVFRGMLDDNNLPYRFCSLLCFDWVADVRGKRVWRWVVSNLGEQARPAQAEISLTWVFVVQSNPQPLHPSFLAEIGGFFDQTIQSNVRRDRTCLVMANTAGDYRPGRVSLYGQTSVLHSANALFSNPSCSPTYSNGGGRKEATAQLGQLHAALFRESGACIHSFLQNNPAALVPGAAGKTTALLRPYVYPLDEGADDPRTPSAVVPACIKWLNDDLDGAKLSNAFLGQPLTDRGLVSHSASVKSLRAIGSQAAENAIRLACPKIGKTADDWGTAEGKALEHVVQTLTVLNVAKRVRAVVGEPSHATLAVADLGMDLVAIRGDSHESCEKHLRDSPPRTRHPILLVSRDEENTEWPKRFHRFLDTPSENPGEINITDPGGNLRCVGYRTIMDAFRRAQNEADLNGALDAAILAA